MRAQASKKSGALAANFPGMTSSRTNQLKIGAEPGVCKSELSDGRGIIFIRPFSMCILNRLILYVSHSIWLLWKANFLLLI